MIFNILTDDDKMDIERYIYTLEGRVDKLTDSVNELYRRLQTVECHTHVTFVTGEIEHMIGKNVPVNKLIQCIMSTLNLEFKHTDASDTVVKRSK